MPSYSRKDVERSFASIMVYRGLDYMERDLVFDVVAESETRIKGHVQGSAERDYEVSLNISIGPSSSKIASSCTCPIGTQCKHGAALALYVLQNPSVVEQLHPTAEAAERIVLPYEVAHWLEHFDRVDPDPGEISSDATAVVIYVLESRGEDTAVRLMNRALAPSGGQAKVTEFKYAAIQSQQMGRHVNPFDQKLIFHMEKLLDREHYNKPIYLLKGDPGARIFDDLVKSGRAFWGSPDGPCLTPGEERCVSISWATDKNGNQTLELNTSPHIRPILTVPPRYVDTASGQTGHLVVADNPEVAALILQAPTIPAEAARSVRERLIRFGLSGKSLPSEPLEIERRRPAPIAKFVVDFVTCQEDSHGYVRSSRTQERPIPFGRLTFEYDGFKGSRERDEIRVLEGDRLLIIQRNSSAEFQMESKLRDSGWNSAKYTTAWKVPHGKKSSWLIEPASRHDFKYLDLYRHFVTEVAPQLREEGWHIELDETYHFVPDLEVDWQLGVESSETLDWFEFKLGIEVEGQKIDLRPHLRNLVQEDLEPKTRDYYSYRYGQPREPEDIFLKLDSGAVVRLPRERLKKLLQPLLELFGSISEWPDKLELPANRILDAEVVRDSVEEIGLAWRTPDELEDLRLRLGNFHGIEERPEPAGFVGTLRPYQREGLGWLAFLLDNGFGGILADDMGLGKTIQVLAHLQSLKNEGTSTGPSLIVAPTSTLPNWRREAAKFAPGLKVLVLHGVARKADFAKIKEHDLVITSYPLLSRDRTQHLKIAYDHVVLDEAQNIKNPATATAKAACELKSRQRLCLSGTPVENHLDELWSLFHFLMPGFLGSREGFRRQYRTPIEQKHDAVAQAKLARKARPFMLRRTKAQVVKDLPPKTEILESIDLADAQRDLYESVRVAMDARVRELLATKGLQKGRIEILDALLKLRQVCCDPRLVKLPSAQNVSDSAKLERLMEMLEVLIEDGRRILLFSQFTSMLDLIESELRQRHIEWVRISGDTKDRDTPVQRFQGGEVPLFLISLKAGGTGLNLVAADTVIHYDPWWNPAVENQATDRAYRIGQDKPVMVYKLVASGTVEEKVLELQERKAALAKSVLSDDAEPLSTLSADDLQAIFS